MTNSPNSDGSDVYGAGYGAGFGSAWPTTYRGIRTASSSPYPGQPGAVRAEVARVTITVVYASYQGPPPAQPINIAPQPDVPAARRRRHPIRRLLIALAIGAAVATPGVLLAKDGPLHDWGRHATAPSTAVQPHVSGAAAPPRGR
ncbi:MAG TPA: hypothetical protein VKV21_14085 [Solirubrobacteraceae bacterium]|nr:hypothetical protein [Solirubrobacteraceae bacterium]